MDSLDNFDRAGEVFDSCNWEIEMFDIHDLVAEHSSTALEGAQV